MRVLGTFPLDLKLAVRNIVRQGRRSWVGFSAVAAGVIALLMAAGFFEFNYNGMREGTIRARIGHVQAVKKGFLDSGMSDPYAYLIPEESADRYVLEALPNADVVAPRLVFSGLVSIGESTISFAGEGVDPVREKQVSGALRIIQGDDLDKIDAKEVIVGRGLAENLGLQPGQTVVLLVTTSSGGPNAVEVRVSGVFETTSKAYDDYALRLPLKTTQDLLRVKGVHNWLVLLNATKNTESYVAAAKSRVQSQDLELVPWYQTATADFYNKTVELFSKQVLVVKLMIAVIIVLSISNTMMTNVRERIGEIGTCMALGDTSATILRRFLAEGAVLGMFGGVIGCVLGYGLATLISWIGIPMPPPPGMASGYVAGIMLTPRIIIDALALAVITAFVAGLYPAWRASRMQIADALRYAK